LNQTDQITIFRSLFFGREDAYGLETKNGPISVKEPLTDKEIQAHMEGNKRIGAYLLSFDSTITWSAFDFDSITTEKLQVVIAKSIESQLYPYVESSKSRGYHVHFFFDSPIQAKPVRALMNWILKETGATGEIFPKQDVSSNNGPGNFLWLPLQAESAKKNRTLFLNSQLTPYPDQWDQLSRVHRTKTQNILELVKELHLDEPQKWTGSQERAKLPEGWEQGYFGAGEGTRNDSLTKLAGRYIGKGLSKEETLLALIGVNQGFNPPLPGREVESVLDSVWKIHHQKHPEEKQDKEPPSYSTLNLPSSLEISHLEVKVEWAVKDLIPKGAIVLLHSIGGVGKSYLLLALGKAVADGQPFFGLHVMGMMVFYIDFENPLPEIADRTRKQGGSSDFKIWHLGHDPAPIRFDADEWEIYKTFPPGLFIIDSLRSSHFLEENSSKDASFIMARFKEIRALGNTIIVIHHENKIGGYRGSTAWFDLSDHILKFSRVKRIGSDEDAEDDDLNLPIRLGLGGKSRFSSAMEFRAMYFRFEDHQLVSAHNPEIEILTKMWNLLDPDAPPNQKEFRKLVKDNLNIERKAFDRLARRGEDMGLWFSKRSRECNKLVYVRGINEAF
jgi:hypothetical protein